MKWNQKVIKRIAHKQQQLYLLAFCYPRIEFNYGSSLTQMCAPAHSGTCMHKEMDTNAQTHTDTHTYTLKYTTRSSHDPNTYSDHLHIQMLVHFISTLDTHTLSQKTYTTA